MREKGEKKTRREGGKRGYTNGVKEACRIEKGLFQPATAVHKK